MEILGTPFRVDRMDLAHPKGPDDVFDLSRSTGRELGDHHSSDLPPDFLD